MSKNKFVAIIPVREGSERVKNKNFKKFVNNESLLHLKIKQLKNQKLIDKIYVSSNSKKAEKIADNLNVNFVKRPNYYCGSKAKLHEYNTYMLESIPGNPEVVWGLVTAPLFSEYDKIIKKYISNKKEGFDSLITTIKYNDFLIDENAKPLNCAFGIWHLFTQHLKIQNQITGSVYIAKKSDQINWQYWFGPNPYMHEVKKFQSIDIDDNEDFEIAQILYSKFFKN